jgi:cold-inducible RNA-binding protein
MSNKLYVGGLAYSTTDQELHSLFDQQGQVLSATVVMDRDSGRSRGFGFVEMSSQEEATNAINELNGKNVGGRTIMVNEAKERAPRRTGSFHR